MSDARLRFDERNVVVVRRICTVMYMLTLMGLVGIVNYRQFVLDQPHDAYDDIAMLLSANVVGLLVAVFYFGGVTVPRFRPLPILGIYALFTALGFGLAWVKSVARGEALDTAGALHTLYVISSILALLMLLWGTSAWLGHRRTERQLR